MIDDFLKELRDSADLQTKIFTEGSCFRLYQIIKTIFPDATAYWSDLDGHCITKVGKEYYDIGGIIKKSYVNIRCYYKIPKNQLRGYSLLKWMNNEDSIGSRVEKYKN